MAKVHPVNPTLHEALKEIIGKFQHLKGLPVFDNIISYILLRSSHVKLCESISLITLQASFFFAYY